MSRPYYKIGFAFLIFLGLIGSASAANIVYGGLEEEPINRSYEEAGVNFQTEYMNQTVEWQNATYDDEIHDWLSKWQIASKSSGSDTIKVKFKSAFAKQKNNPDVPSYLANRKVKEKISIKKGETKSTLYDGIYMDDSGAKVMEVSAESHYEHLIVTYEMFASNGTKMDEFQDVYSGDDTQRIPVSGEVVQKSASKVTQTISKDNLYEPETTEKLIIAHEPETSISSIDFKGMTHENISVNFSEDVRPELESVNMSNGDLENPEDYEFTAYNVTYPENTKNTIEVNFTQPVYNPLTDNPENYQFEYYSYIVGSVATFKTDTSSEWNDGSSEKLDKSSDFLTIANVDKTFESSNTLTLYYIPYDLIYEIRIFGAGGGSSCCGSSDGASGGDGGYIQGDIDLDKTHTLEIYSAQPGEKGGSFSNPGGWGYNTGGSINDGSNAGTGAGSSAVIFEGNSSLIAEAGGGGGASRVYENTNLNEYYCYPGGGGGGGGLAGSVDSCAGESGTASDGQGTSGVGGDGGDALKGSGDNGKDGNDGSYRTNGYFISSSGTVGGGSAGAPQSDDVGTGGKVRILGSASSGVYNSAVYSASEKKVWDNITLSNFNKNGGSIDIWIKTSNDGFGTTLEEEKVPSSQLSSSGNQTVDLSLSEGATDVKYNISYSKGSSSPSIDSLELDGKTANKQPVLENQSLNVDRTTGNNDLSIGIDDGGENDIDILNGISSPDTFSNETIQKNGIGLPYSSTVNVSDFKGAIASNIELNFDTSVGVIDERSSFSHTLSTQRNDKDWTITNNAGNGLDYDVTMESIATNLIQGSQFTGTVSASSSVTETQIGEGDWISITGTNSLLNANDSRTNTFSTQYQLDEDRIDVDNSKGYKFTGVDTSTKCNYNTSVDIGSGSQTINKCNVTESSGDWITVDATNSFTLENSSRSHNLTTQYEKQEDRIDLTNSKSYSFDTLDTSSRCNYNTSVKINGGSNTINNCNVTENSGDYIIEETLISTESENSSKSQNLSTQYSKNITDLSLNNQKTYKFSSVDVSSKCTDNTTADIPAGTNNVTDCRIGSASGDWLTESAESFSQNKVNTTETDGTTYITLDQVNVTNTKDFNITDVNITSLERDSWTCSSDQVNVSAGAKGQYNKPVNCTKDSVIKEENSSHFVDNSYIEVGSNITVSTSTTINNTDNTVGYSDVKADLKDKRASLHSMYAVNDQTPNVTIGARKDTVQSIEYKGELAKRKTDMICDSGFTKYSSYCFYEQTFDSKEEYEYKYRVNVTEDIASDKPFRLPLNTDNLKNWDQKSDVIVSVNSSTVDVNLQDVENPYIEVGTNYGESSFHNGTYTFSLDYQYEGGTSSGSGGGGGSGPVVVSEDNENDTIQSILGDKTLISFERNPIEETFTTGLSKFDSLNIANNYGEEVNVTISRRGGNACQYIDFTDTNSDERFVVNVDKAGTVKKFTSLDYKISPPEGTETVSCKYEALVKGEKVAETEFVLNREEGAFGALTAIPSYAAELLKQPALSSLLGQDKICTDMSATTEAGSCDRETDISGLKVWHLVGVTSAGFGIFMISGTRRRLANFRDVIIRAIT